MESDVAGTPRPAAVVAVVAWAVAVVAVATGIVLLVVPDGPMPPHGFGSAAGDAIVAVAYAAGATVGALIAVRRPRSPLGWVMLAAGFLTGTASATSEYYTVALAHGLPGAALTAWYGASAWYLGAGLAVSFALLLFPTGRLPSRRWRAAAWLSALTVAALTASRALAPGPLAGEFRLVANTFGVDAAPWLVLLRDLEWALLLGLTAVSGLALLSRRRRAGVVERAQLKWFAYAAGLATAAIALRSPALFGEAGPLWAQALLVLAVLSLPLAFGVAVLRYRLFEINRVVSRTVSYALLTALLGGVYAAAALLASRALAPFDPGSDLAVAAATLAAAGVFRPARVRIQDAVDRRFNRSRYDVATVLESLHDDLRGQHEPERMVAALLTAVGAAFQPATVSVWLPARAAQTRSLV